MTGPLQQLLRKRRDEAIEVAERTLQKGGNGDIEPLLQKISIYNSILSSMPDKKPDRVNMFLIGLFCVSAIGLAWGIRMPQTAVVLTVDSQAVNIDMSEPLNWSDEIMLQPDNLSIVDMDSLQLPGGVAGFESEKAAWANITGGRLQLSALKRSPGGEFSMEMLDNSGIEIRSKNAGISGAFTLSGDTIVLAGNSLENSSSRYPLKLIFPETVGFGSYNNSAVPSVLRLGLKEELFLLNLEIQGLSFSQLKTTNAGSDEFFSSISSGSIQLSDISESIDLNRSEPLILGGVSGRLTELRIKDKISIRFEGTVEEIFIGQGEFLQDLRPSIFQYIYHHERLSLFISALTFLWGVSWSAKRLLFT